MSDHPSPEQVLKDEVVELSIKLIEAKFAVEEALIHQEWKHKVRMLMKHRRDSKVNLQESKIEP